ncbi:hypothetical protein MSG28_000533 [Choristoneura fumiferana]|uniref:Uncharacterized protein n=1 Tax=Choristoneura fumiferana TaxID=7141 RepID=A0ACC0K1A9_CHOFU|nr:hypothetical protein MSG28_000533 [Choristoneura fumiferana]
MVIGLARYHEWMKSEELQMLTASEPLTLEQEYEMQKSWREDEDKCTFIVLDKVKFEDCSEEVDAMIGDTNIFITDKESSTGEIEIMIAEKYARGRKLGWEAVILMILYGINQIAIKNFEAKISMKNVISITMFQKLLFKETSRSEAFQEITLAKAVDDEWANWLETQYKYQIQPH